MDALHREQPSGKYPKIADNYVFLSPVCRREENSAVAQQINKQQRGWRNDVKIETLLITGLLSLESGSLIPLRLLLTSPLAPFMVVICGHASNRFTLFPVFSHLVN